MWPKAIRANRLKPYNSVGSSENIEDPGNAANLRTGLRDGPVATNKQTEATKFTHIISL